MASPQVLNIRARAVYAQMLGSMLPPRCSPLTNQVAQRYAERFGCAPGDFLDFVVLKHVASLAAYAEVYGTDKGAAQRIEMEREFLEYLVHAHDTGREIV